MARFNLVIQAVYHAEADGTTIIRMEAGPLGGVLLGLADGQPPKPYWVYDISAAGDLINLAKFTTLLEGTTEYQTRRDQEV